MDYTPNIDAQGMRRPMGPVDQPNWNGGPKLIHSGAVAGTPVQLAFQLGGATMPETTMVATPGAANASNNVATSTLIKNCCGDYDRITVTNTGTADVTVAANSAFIVRRLA